MDNLISGALYVVATPIGNLGDISGRALEILKSVTRIAAEDTRHSQRLLSHYAISTPLTALHEHNEQAVAPALIKRLREGETLALISDAGTPLISDPGYRLVCLAREQDIQVVPVPGPSAAVAALSAAGLPTDHWVFEGFLPSKTVARCKRLDRLSHESRTLVFYESAHRIESAISDMAKVFGDQRTAVIAREMTKTFETISSGTLADLLDMTRSDPDQRKGEFVVVVAGAPEDSAADDSEARRVLAILSKELPVKKAAAVAAELTGQRRNRLYELALDMKPGD